MTGGYEDTKILADNNTHFSVDTDAYTPKLTNGLFSDTDACLFWRMLNLLEYKKHKVTLILILEINEAADILLVAMNILK